MVVSGGYLSEFYKTFFLPTISLSLFAQILYFHTHMKILGNLNENNTIKEFGEFEQNARIKCSTAFFCYFCEITIYLPKETTTKKGINR